MATKNQNQSLKCELCDTICKTIQGMRSHERSKGHLKKLDEQDNQVIEKEIIKDYNVDDILEKYDILKKQGFNKHGLMNYSHIFIEKVKTIPDDIINAFEEIIHRYYKQVSPNFKVQMGINVIYIKDDKKIRFGFNTERINIVLEEDINLSSLVSKIHSKITEENLIRSGLIFDSIEKIFLYIHKYRSPVGGTYIKTPYSPSILNIQNKDNKCFMWSILAYLHKDEIIKNVCRVNKYKKYEHELKMEGIKYPVGIKEIKKFNEQNEIKVNVFIWEGDQNIVPLVRSHLDVEGCNLFLYKNHYVLCTNISAFMRHSKKNKAYPCLNCMCSFKSENKYQQHISLCVEHKPCEPTFPKNDYLTFNNYHYKNPVPIVCYADFECYNINLEDEEDKKKIFQQKPMCYGIYVKSVFGDRYISYYGEDAVEKFVDEVVKLNKECQLLLETNNKIIMTKKDLNSFELESKCFYCNEDLNDDKVRDHDHLTGKYRGAAHNDCNLKAKKIKFVPFFFHNGMRYDNHFFFVELIAWIKDKIIIIPKTDEDYISFEFGCIRFLDSLRFLPESLDKLGNRLKEYKILSERNLKFKKGIYPYEYIQTEDKFDTIDNIMKETKLPLRKNFYSTLKQKEITNNEYKQAQKDWKELNCETMLDYTMKYLEIDVCLLADVFEQFRMMCLDYYEIDPCYCYTTPGLTWLAGLKMTGVKLKYYKEETYDKLLFYEKGIRGGFAGVLGDRHVKCINRKTDEKLKFFDELGLCDLYIEAENEQKNNLIKENYVLHYDANSLYPYAMTQELPTGEMKWSENLTYEKTIKNMD